MTAPEPREESSQSRSEQRRASERRSSLFREVNEQIEQLSRDWDTDDPGTIYCECGRPDCLERLEIPADDYEEARRSRIRFIVQPEH
jgi:hypothetical protein